MKKLRSFILLWSSQSLSQLGSTMTSLALSVWLYEKTGSALQAALLNICTYTPYILVSIFAGALSDKWNKKKTMLICDSFAVISSLVVFILFKRDLLKGWHLYALGAFSGLMNTFQEPASETAMSILTPREYYQKTSGLKSFSRSLISIFAPILSTSIYSLFGMKIVFYIDFISFAIAFVVLALFIEIKEIEHKENETNMLVLIKEGFNYLKDNRLILDVILFLSGINLVASSFESILNPYILLKTNNNESILGIVTSFSGIAMLMGSFIVTIMKEPKNKVKVIYEMMFISMLLENFLVSFTVSPVIWCIAQILGWLPVPIMSASYDVLFKTSIPIEMLGRVYSFRNCLQFFTIPVGNFVGGLLVDVLEPYMINSNNLFTNMFGSTAGSGAALALFIVAIFSIIHCLLFRGKLLKK